MRKVFTVIFAILLSTISYVNAQTYCTAGSQTCDEYISRVVLNTIDKSSSCTNYADYTSTNSTTLQSGVTYSASVYIGNAYTSDIAGIYIDWNGDKDFTDAGELCGSASYSGTNPVTISVKAPSTFTYYGNTRMRVVMGYYNLPSSCGSFYYGEVEDYTITLPSPAPMQFGSISASHPDTNDCFISQTFVKILKATCNTKTGSYNALKIDTVWFSTTGTTDPADILNAKLFSMDGNPLSPATQVGSPVLLPNGEFYFVFPTGSKLNYGDNNLFVGYDVNYKAKANNYLDCQLIKARIGDTIRYPATGAGNPVGRKRIVHPKDYTQYCDMTRNSGLNYLIGLVRFMFEGIDNTTGVYVGTGSCVGFYPATIPTVYKQQTYEMTMQHAAFNSRQAKVYIDWNNNSFWEATELMFTYSSILPATVVKQNITMPCDAVPGYHRMRIVIDGVGYGTTSCGTNYLGEAEDYLFYLAPEESATASFTLFNAMNYVGGRTAFVPKADKGGNIKYVWDFDNNNTWDDTTTGEAGFKYTTSGLKTVGVKAILTTCDNQIVSGPTFKDTFTIYTPPSKPIVNFISSANTVTTSIPVKFSDLTTYGPFKWKWTILPKKAGNGNDAYTISSDTVKEPTVQFHELGEYDVQLVATNILGADSVMKTKYIVVVKENLICIDKNTDARNGYLYDNGGKYGNYPENNATQVYETCGFLIKPKCAASITIDFIDFDVCIYNSTGCAQLTAGDNVRVYDGKDNNANQLHLGPKDILGNPMFPDGFQNGAGNIERTIPSVTATSGVMYVEFNRNCGGVGRGFEAFWSTQTLNVSPPDAKIIGPTSSVYRLKKIKFASASTGVDLEYFWDLNGDGYNDTYDSATSWVYTSTGTVKVRLVVRSCDYFDTAYLTFNIINPTKKPSVDFEANYTRATKNDDVTITNKSDNTIYSNEWTITPANFTFLDGTGINSEDIKVRFNKTGTYTVKLKAYNAVGFDSMQKVNYITVYDPCIPGVANLSSDIGMSVVDLKNLAGNSLISNKTLIGQQGYSDYTKTHFATLYATGQYNLTLERNSSFNSISWTVFIDYNQDGQYNNATEKVAEIINFSGEKWTATFTVPNLSANVLKGLSRLRIVANAGILTNKGCGPNYTGEFEDYGLEISLDNVKPMVILYGLDSSIVSSPDTTVLNSCATWVEPGYKGWDDVSGDITSKVVVTGTSSINPLVGGYYPLTYTVTDNAGNTSETAKRIVHVLADIIPPTITLYGKNPDSVAVGGSWNDLGYLATDNCSGVKNHGKTGSVNTAVVGEYTITYNAEDNATNKKTFERKVVIYDGIDPTIKLIGKDTIYIDVKTAYTEPGVTVGDNYYNTSELTVTTKGTVNPDKLGSYFLTYCVSDPSGNGPVCVDRLVVVQDVIAPIISFKESIYEIDVFSPFVAPTPDKSDNYWPESSLIVTQTGTVNTFVLGDYILTFTAKDPSGNVSAPKQITIRVIDRVVPTIELNGSTMMTVERWRTLKDPGVKIKDNYYKESELIMKPNTGTFTVASIEGLYTITYQVCDPSNNCSEILTRFILVTPADTNNSIGDNLSDNNFRVYPNPATDQVNIEVNLPAMAKVNVSIYNSFGQKVSEVANLYMMNDQFSIGTDNLSDGVYYVRLTIDNQQFNKKVVITK